MRVIKLFIALVISLVLMINTVWASVSGNSTAFCVGTEYTDVNTTLDAQLAGGYYSSLGITTVEINIVPTTTNMNGNHSNGQKYLASGIVFLSGHGSEERMSWNFLGNGGNAAVGVTKSLANYSNGTYYYYSLSNYNTSDVALYVFAGCNTGKGTSNIAKWVVDNGAKISIGWKTEVKATSHTHWLNRFNNYISQGYSVSAACNYADSFTYIWNSGVKQYNKYGLYSNNPYYYISSRSSSCPIEEFDARFIGEIDCSESNAYDCINDFLLQKYNAEILSNFSVEKNENQGTIIYDYTISEGRINSLIGFTFIEKDGVIKVFDNTLGFSLYKLISKMKEFNENEGAKLNSIFENSENRHKTENMFNVEQFVFFNQEDEVFYEVFSYDAIDNDGLYYSDFILSAIE